MDVWKRFENKKVFLRTNNNRVYCGIVQEVVDVGNGIIFISLIDKNNKWVTIINNEIAEIKEED